MQIAAGALTGLLVGLTGMGSGWMDGCLFGCGRARLARQPMRFEYFKYSFISFILLTLLLFNAFRRLP